MRLSQRILNPAFLLFTLLSFSVSSFAGDLPCYDRSDLLPINNDQVLEWLDTTHDQFEARANIVGHLVEVSQIRDSHFHLLVQIGNDSEDLIEVIYNRHFGDLPQDWEIGVEIQACGDYITDPTTVSGATGILHWVHFNPGNRSRNHEDGFLIIDDVPYGANPDGFDGSR